MTCSWRFPVVAAIFALLAPHYSARADETDLDGIVIVELSVTMQPNELVKRGHMEEGVNAVDKDGNTPLMLAIKARDVEVVDYLLKNGADPWIKDSGGSNASDLAHKWGNAGVIAWVDDFVKQYRPADEYYKGKHAVLTTESQLNQSGSPDAMLDDPLVVVVRDAGGNPMAGAPVKFSVPAGAGGFMTSSSGAVSPALVLYTNEKGEASVIFRLPDKPSARGLITVTTGAADAGKELNFNTLTNDGKRGENHSPFAPSDIQVARDDKLGVIVDWKNNSEMEYSIIHVSLRLRDGTLKRIYDLPGNWESVYIPPDVLKRKLPLPPPAEQLHKPRQRID